MTFTYKKHEVEVHERKTIKPDLSTPGLPLPST